MDESDVEFLSEQGWLNAEVDAGADEVRHVPPSESGEPAEVHPLAAIRDCLACRALDVAGALPAE
jgi:hypothetical protein